jgi:hypothetical protein
MLELRAFLNEGGKLLYTGRSAGWQYANAFDYNPVTTPPFCDNVDQTVDDGCLLLSDDFLQYWLGAQLFIEDGGTNAATDEPFGMSGTADGPFAGTAWTLNGGDSADNHHANDSRGTTQSFLTTSSLHPPEDYPQFASESLASWDTGVAGAFSPHTGDHYLYSGRADVSYKRLTNTIDLTGGGVTDPTLSFFTSYDTELDWDFMFVEAHTVGEDNWTTLPDINGHTTNNTGESCPEGWHELHPFLAHYQGFDEATATCTPTGSSGTWNAASGSSGGWQEWNVSLAPFAGDQIEISISYVSDWSTQGLGVFIDDVNLLGESTSFETALEPWTVPGPPEGSAPNANDFQRITGAGFPEGAAVAMDDSVLQGYGVEGITGAAARRDVVGRTMRYLLR